MPRLDEPNDRLRNEIEEILEAEEKRESEPPVRIARPVKPRRVRTGTPLWMPTPEKMIAAGIIILLVGALIRQFVVPLLIIGFALSGIGYYMLVRRKRSERYGGGRSSRGSSAAPETKYWRGRPVDEQPKKVKTRDGNVVEFPDTLKNKARRRFGKKK